MGLQSSGGFPRMELLNGLNYPGWQWALAVDQKLSWGCWPGHLSSPFAFSTWLELLRARSGFREEAYLEHKSRPGRSLKDQPWTLQCRFCSLFGGRKSRGQPRLVVKVYRLHLSMRSPASLAKHLQPPLTHCRCFPHRHQFLWHSVPQNVALTLHNCCTNVQVHCVS